jgi:transcriptional regulator with XRE-family HTH domain
VAELDGVMGGLYWGDNVLWEAPELADVRPFVDAFARGRASYGSAFAVVGERTPEEAAAALPGFAVLDARPGQELAHLPALLAAIRRVAERGRPTALVFDPIDGFARAWGAEAATAFFVRCCPLLLELGAVAYWTLTGPGLPPAFRREIEDVTQCVMCVGDGRVRIGKAEGRPHSVRGSIFRYTDGPQGLTLEGAPMAARLGVALRAVRAQRRLSQSDVARLAGVSPSAISQAERGQRGLSLETLLQLSEQLNLTLDELLRGESSQAYRIARRVEGPVGAAVSLFDQRDVGVRVLTLRVPPRAVVTAQQSHKGTEVVLVARGLVQVVLDSGRPVIREGEAVLVEEGRVERFRNLGDTEASLFWVLRDVRR